MNKTDCAGYDECMKYAVTTKIKETQEELYGFVTLEGAASIVARAGARDLCCEDCDHYIPTDDDERELWVRISAWKEADEDGD